MSQKRPSVATMTGTRPDDELAETQRLLNIRPRRILGYRKPADMINELINGVALTT